MYGLGLYKTIGVLSKIVTIGLIMALFHILVVEQANLKQIQNQIELGFTAVQAGHAHKKREYTV
jgi:hypothetical protein